MNSKEQKLRIAALDMCGLGGIEVRQKHERPGVLPGLCVMIMRRVGGV